MHKLICCAGHFRRSLLATSLMWTRYGVQGHAQTDPFHCQSQDVIRCAVREPCLVTRPHSAVDASGAIVGEGDCAGRDVPALQRACARQESALGALRVQPRLECMALRPSYTPGSFCNPTLTREEVYSQQPGRFLIIWGHAF